METQPKEEEHVGDNHSETEPEEEASESIDHYHGPATETPSMSVDDEDDHDDDPFVNVPYYFQPIYIGTAHVEDPTPKHFMYSEEQHLGTEYEKAYDYMDDEPGLFKPNSMETQTSEQQDYHVKHMEIEQDEALESMGHYHYGSGREARGMLDDEDVRDGFPFKHSSFYFRPTYIDTISHEDTELEHFIPLHKEDYVKNFENWGENADDDRRFHGHMRASRDGHENTDERNSRETGTAYKGNENPEGSNHYTMRNRRGEDGDSESFGSTHDDVIDLVTGYRTHMEPEYGENGILDGLMAIKRGESHIVSPEDVVNSGGDNEDYHNNEADEDELRAFEETKASKWDNDNGDDEESENIVDNEDNEYAQDDVEFQDPGGNLEENEDSDWEEDDEGNEDTGNSEDFEDVEGDEVEDEDEFLVSWGGFEETEASDWDENDEDSEDDEYKEVAEDDNEDKKDNEEIWDDEDEFQDSGEETETSDWAEGDEDNGDYGNDEDDKDDNKEVEKDASRSDFKITEASDYGDNYEASRDDLEENAAAEWNEGHEGDVVVSEGETKTNVNTAYDASVSEKQDYELVDDVAYGYKQLKGVGGSHISKEIEQ